jgi:hypothetical protein
LAKSQSWLQPPQCCKDLRKASHPFTGLASQSPYPCLQLGVHTPAEHEVVPFGLVQVTPQPPQLPWEVTCISQPLDISPSQLPQPVLHVIVQAPAVHDALPLTPTQAFPHEPQFAIFVEVFVSQPFCTFESQLANPGLHTGTHALAMHEVVPLGLVHAFAHAPQLSTDVCRSVSHPFCTLLSQLPNPLLHTGEQTLPTQLVVPFALVQALPHAPQLPVELCVFVSQPFAGLPSQLA